MDAINVVRLKHPKVVHVGDVRMITEKEVCFINYLNKSHAVVVTCFMHYLYS